MTITTIARRVVGTTALLAALVALPGGALATPGTAPAPVFPGNQASLGAPVSIGVPTGPLVGWIVA